MNAGGQLSEDTIDDEKGGSPEVNASPMRAIQIDKVVVHMCVGESGQMLVNAEGVMETITGQKPVRTVAKRTNQTFGIKKDEPIGCMVTLRGDAAVKFLKTALGINQNVLDEYVFDSNGNLSFGIAEHTEFPGMSYDPKIGIYGMDIPVSFKRAGYRIKHRKIHQHRRIPTRHKIAREEAMEYMTKEFGVSVM